MNERINISMPSDLLARIDEAAAAAHLTRSGFLRAVALERLEGRSPSGGLHGADAVGEPVAIYGASAPGSSASLMPAIWDRAQVLPLLRAFFAGRSDVQVAYLIGSVARGEAGPMSDLDVAVLLGEGLDVPERMSVQLDLLSRLGALFGSDDIDVVVLDEAPAPLAFAAISEGVVVAGERSATRLAFEDGTRRRFETERPAIEARHRALMERIRSGGFFDR